MHAIHRVKKVMVLLFVLAGCTSVDAGRATAEAYEACKSEFERLYVLHEGRVNPEFDDLPGRIGLRMRIWPPGGRPYREELLLIEEGQVFSAEDIPKPPVGASRASGPIPRRTISLPNYEDIDGYQLAPQVYRLTSPDRRFFALTARGTDRTTEHSTVLILDQNSVHVVAHAYAGNDATIVGLAWSPDSQYLAYLTYTIRAACSGDGGMTPSGSYNSDASEAGISALELNVIDRNRTRIASEKLVDGGHFLVDLVWMN